MCCGVYKDYCYCHSFRCSYYCCSSPHPSTCSNLHQWKNISHMWNCMSKNMWQLPTRVFAVYSSMCHWLLLPIGTGRDGWKLCTSKCMPRYVHFLSSVTHNHSIWHSAYCRCWMLNAAGCLYRQRKHFWSGGGGGEKAWICIICIHTTKNGPPLMLDDYLCLSSFFVSALVFFHPCNWSKYPAMHSAILTFACLTYLLNSKA